MCGISGFFEKGLAKQSASTQVKLMSAAITHRGPNEYGSFIDEEDGVALAHQRLSIQDLTIAGSQPMSSDCGRYVIVFNGEIYNFNNLKESLQDQYGVREWRGHSDTEVLLTLISLKGIDNTLKDITGMFAFSLWDKKKKELYLVRDRFGEKPLYYYQGDDFLVFSSELKSLFKYRKITAEVNVDCIGLYLRYGYIPGAMCLLKGAKKVRPATYVKVSFVASSKVMLEEVSYWSYKSNLFDQSPLLSLEESAIDKLDGLLSGVVEKQLIADVNVGSFLSGGVDSSLIAAIVRLKLDRPLKTFSIGFEDPRYDEAPFASKTANYLGTEHYEHYVKSNEIFELVESIPDIFDEPIGDSSVLPTYLVSKMAKENVTVALSGDGGDELFGGYNHYRWGGNVINAISVIPKKIRIPLSKILNDCGGVLSNQALIKFSRILEESVNVSPTCLLNSAFGSVSKFVENIAEDELNVLAQSSLSNLELKQRLMALDLFGFLPNDILVKVDRAAMACSLETRAPFLDHNIAKFAWRLPNNLRATKSRGKVVLRELLSRYIPEKMFERPKQGFGLPLDSWFRGELKSFVEAKLDFLVLNYAHLISPELIRCCWKEHLEFKYNRQREIWTLVSLAMYLELYQ